MRTSPKGAAAGAEDRAALARRALARRTRRIADLLAGAYPDAACALDHRGPFELLVATILAAQCTDERVNQVTPALFARFPDSAAMAAADPVELESLVRSTGFYRAKAKSIHGAAETLARRFAGAFPSRIEDLLTLPGVGRKTANVVLGTCFGVPAIIVDTHVRRVSQRLDLASSDDPDEIERQLQSLLPAEDWTAFSHQLTFHGRAAVPRAETRLRTVRGRRVLPIAHQCLSLIFQCECDYLIQRQGGHPPVKKIIAALCTSAFLFVGFSASAQSKPLVLPVSKESPTVDGVASASEYPVGAEVGKMNLWLSRTADTLYVAVSGQTTGSVAVGFGSPKMDGSLIFIAFVGADGKATMKIQKGAGHSHGDVESDALIQFAVKEDKGVTTLELALKAPSVIAKGATDLPVIYATGGADNFTSFMSFRGSVPVKLQ